jgi:hypothetical protein
MPSNWRMLMDLGLPKITASPVIRVIEEHLRSRNSFRQDEIRDKLESELG